MEEEKIKIVRRVTKGLGVALLMSSFINVLLILKVFENNRYAMLILTFTYPLFVLLVVLRTNQIFKILDETSNQEK